MTKKQREQVKEKYVGLCAYSGTPLEDDWQVDHVQPKIGYLLGLYEYKDPNHIDNLYPCQKIINHYKRGLSVEQFRIWYLGGLHKRLEKLPKNPRTDKGQKKKDYLLKVASYFGITPTKPFSQKFYFETL